MKFFINFGTIATALTTTAIIAFVGGVWDFQNLKARVTSTEKELNTVSLAVLTLAKITCKRAIIDGIKDADEICAKVIK